MFGSLTIAPWFYFDFEVHCEWFLGFRVLVSCLIFCSTYNDLGPGGGGGKGTWGSLLSSDGQLEIDRNDPNYDSEEVFILGYSDSISSR